MTLIWSFLLKNCELNPFGDPLNFLSLLFHLRKQQQQQQQQQQHQLLKMFCTMNFIFVIFHDEPGK